MSFDDSVGSEADSPSASYGNDTLLTHEAHSVAFGHSLEESLADLETLRSEIKADAIPVNERIEMGCRHYEQMRENLNASIEQSLRSLDEMEARYPEDWQERASRSLSKEAIHQEAVQRMHDARIEHLELLDQLDNHMTKEQHDLQRAGFKQVFPQGPHAWGLPHGDPNLFSKDGNLYYLQDSKTYQYCH